MSQKVIAVATVAALMGLAACGQKPAEEAAPAADTTVTTETMPVDAAAVPADPMADPMAAPADAMAAPADAAAVAADPATAAADAAVGAPAVGTDSPGNTGPDKGRGSN